MGIEVAYDRLPFPSVVLRFARAFQFDPLRMISSGTLAVTLPPDQIDAVSADLEALGVPCALVPRVVEGEGVRVLWDDGVTRCTDIRCEKDDLVRMWTLYPWDYCLLE